MCVTLLPGDIWKSLEMYLIVTAHGVSAAGIQLVEVRMLLNTLSAEGSGHNKELLDPRCPSAESKKPWSRMFFNSLFSKSRVSWKS